MSVTVYLREAVDGRNAIDCEEVGLRGDVGWLSPVDEDRELVIPVENICGVAGEEVSQEVDHLPTQGGQYSEVVTRIS